MGNHLKTPLAASLNVFAKNKINDSFQLTGKALPCSVVSVVGSIVTVKFEINSQFTLPNVTMPLFGPEYIRYPIQTGCKGIAIPADAYIGGMSGLGGGVSDLSRRANLSTLSFLPIGNTEWSSVDPNAVTIYGPNGVVLRDTGGNSTFVLTPTSITMIGKNSVTVESGGTSLILNSSGSYTLKGTSGSLLATAGLTINDGAHGTSPSIMNAAWAALVSWPHSHDPTYPQGGNTGVPPAPFSGGSIAPRA
jgi:hypothetical protein